MTQEKVRAARKRKLSGGNKIRKQLVFRRCFSESVCSCREQKAR